MEIYNYSSLNGEFTIASTPDESPLEPGVYLIPAFATETPPLADKEGFVSVWQDDEWIYVEDHRGTRYWFEDGSEHIQMDIGPFPEGALLEPPENHIGEVYWMPDGSVHVMTTLGPFPPNSSLVPPPPTLEQTKVALNFAVQGRIDAVAQSWGYDSAVSCSSYVNSTNPQFAADAVAIIEWRDTVWVWANPKFSTVVAGEDPETFMQGMPVAPEQPKVV